MTEQEAINGLKRLFSEHELDLPCTDSLEVLNMAIKALEKQIPKKPIIRSWDAAKCPSCNAELSDAVGDGYYKHWEHLKVCNCGQKLDWR